MHSAVHSEETLRQFWIHQPIPSPIFTTADERAVQILHPGALNTDAGPDFRNALVRIGGTLFRGDVELHIDASSWFTHGHHLDPHYNQVVLHVALSQRPFSMPVQSLSQRHIPLLLLNPSLLEIRHQPDHPDISDNCPLAAQALSPSHLRRTLGRLSHQRLQAKASRLKARLHDILEEQGNSPDATTRRTAWEQLLYEELLDCLGYSKNRRPMGRLGRGMRLEILRSYPIDDALTMQALLLGSAGLLPVPARIPDFHVRRHVRELRRRWRTLRSSYRGPVLHEADWLSFRLHPANIPTARLAVMATLLPVLFGGQGIRRLIQLMRGASRPGTDLVREFTAMFLVRPEGIWKSHVHFFARRDGPGAVLGRGRILDILVNAITPFLLLYGCTFKDRTVRSNALRLYACIPRLQENHITRRMRMLLGTKRMPIRRALEQQGMIQAHEGWCKEGKCGACPFTST